MKKIICIILIVIFILTGTLPAFAENAYNELGSTPCKNRNDQVFIETNVTYNRTGVKELYNVLIKDHNATNVTLNGNELSYILYDNISAHIKEIEDAPNIISLYITEGDHTDKYTIDYNNNTATINDVDVTATVNIAKNNPKIGPIELYAGRNRAITYFTYWGYNWETWGSAQYYDAKGEVIIRNMTISILLSLLVSLLTAGDPTTDICSAIIDAYNDFNNNSYHVYVRADMWVEVGNYCHYLRKTTYYMYAYYHIITTRYRDYLGT